MLLLKGPLESPFKAEVVVCDRTVRPCSEVEITIRIINASDSEACVESATTVEVGLVKVEIAREGEEFRQYVGSRWGLYCVFSRRIPLQPGQAFERWVKIQRNVRSSVGEYNKGRLTTSCAFEEPGRYLLRVRFLDSVTGEWIASEPVEIDVGRGGRRGRAGLLRHEYGANLHE